MKVGKHILSGFSMSTILSFKDIENKHDVYRGKDFMKNFWECLKKHARKIINFKKEKITKRTVKLKKKLQKTYLTD